MILIYFTSRLRFLRLYVIFSSFLISSLIGDRNWAHLSNPNSSHMGIHLWLSFILILDSLSFI